MLILAAPLYLSHAAELPVPAIEQASAPTADVTPLSQYVMTTCEKKCDDQYEADSIACTKVAGDGERKKCNDRAHARYTSCRKDCGDDAGDQGLKQCKEDCAYQHGRDIEACSRLRDPTKRPACYDKANQKHATCKRDCEKKYKRGSN